MKKCDICGYLNNDNQQFCVQCGNNFLNTPQQNPTYQPYYPSSAVQPQQQFYQNQPPNYAYQNIQNAIEEQNKHNKKVTRNTIIIIVSIFIAIIFFNFVFYLTDDDTYQSPSNSLNENSTLNENIIDNKYELSLTNSKVVTDNSNKKVLIVTFDFKNLTDEATNFSYSLDAKAFDDGVELDTPISMWGIDGYDFHNNDLDIKPGKSIQVQEAYYLNNNTKEVDIEIVPWVSFNEEIIYKTFKINID